jgi:hypothetical protein
MIMIIIDKWPENFYAILKFFFTILSYAKPNNRFDALVRGQEDSSSCSCSSSKIPMFQTE